MSLTIVVDDENVLRVLRNTADALEHVITPIAKDVAKEAREAGRAVTPKLGAEWHIDGRGAERRVEAPEWWAHFLAGGTKDHGPRKAPLLRFSIDGNVIHATHVRGIAATHFDKKAVDRSKSHVTSIIEHALQEASK